MAELLSASDNFMWSLGRDPVLRSTIVSLTMLDRAPDWDVLADRFDRVSRLVPRFRQRITRSTSLVPPHWETDPDFDLGNHLHRVTLPAESGTDALFERIGLLAAADWDRSHSLWEATLFEGLDGGGAAFVCKFDHAISDGVGAVGLSSILFDRSETPQPPGALLDTPDQPPTHWGDEIRAVVRGEINLARKVLNRSVAALPTLGRAVRYPAEAFELACSTAASVVRAARLTSGPGSPIMVHRSETRNMTIHEVPTAALRAAGNAVGGSLNDAFLGAVMGGLRIYHLKHGTTAKSLTVSMPISIRSRRAPLAGNRATLMRFDVPADLADPVQRIRAVHQLTSEARAERSLAYTGLLAGALTLVPHWYADAALRRVDVLASDVPGLCEQVYLAGAPVSAQYAFSPTLGAAVNVTLLSYRDSCAIGVNVDVAAIPDVGVFHDCLVAGFDETLALAG